MPKVSVVIPCFNQGAYLDEAVQSVLNQTYVDYEIIVVNDGSTDEITTTLLESYNKPKTRIIHTDNQGLPSARNNGIAIAKSEYILTLDADDKIGETYLENAVQILDSQPDIGIVYCDAEYFGEITGSWDLPKFSIENILVMNMIFCSAVFRRTDWEKVNGYNVNMIYGYEDWDFWLSLIALNRNVHKIQKVLFYYRIKKDSMIKQLNQDRDRHIQMLSQGFLNHIPFYKIHIGKIFERLFNNNEKISLCEAEINHLREKIKKTEVYLEKEKIENNELYRIIDNLKNSWSYKVGSFIVNLLKVPQRLIFK